MLNLQKTERHKDRRDGAWAMGVSCPEAEAAVALGEEEVGEGDSGHWRFYGAAFPTQQGPGAQCWQLQGGCIMGPCKECWVALHRQHG